MTSTFPGITKVVQIDNKDWLLQSLLNIVNSGGLSFGITLNVGGFLVSGHLVGGKEYFEGFGAEFASGISDISASESIRASLAEHGKIYDTQQDDDAPPPSYIHIKEAKFFTTSGSPVPGNRGVWWRGRLSQVDGFSLGILNN